jgi:hypothetical protein
MELVTPALARQLRGYLIDALGHDQHRSIYGLRQKISHRTVETTRQHDALPILGYEGKGAVNAEDRVHVTSEQPAPSLRFVDRPEALGFF